MPKPFLEVAPGVWQTGNSHNPDLVMLHGWFATGPTNFSFASELLSQRWHVTAFDLHGHGTRLHDQRKRTTVKDITEDVITRMDTAGISNATILGFSLGGAVAQQLWLDAKHLVGGLVLAGTATKLSPTPIAELALKTMASTYRVNAPILSAAGAATRGILRLGANRSTAIVNLSGLGEYDNAAIQMMAKGIADFNSREWVTKIDVPTAVVVCLNDRMVPTRRQKKLAELTNATKTLFVPGGHLGFLRHSSEYAQKFDEAAKTVSPATSNR